MTWWFARDIALTLLDGEWFHEPMVQRLAAIVVKGRPWSPVEEDEPNEDEDAAEDAAAPARQDTRSWMDWLVDDARAQFAEVPRHVIDRFSIWVYTHAAFIEACREGWTLQRATLPLPLPGPEMGDRRWPTPAIANHRELACWLGIPGETLDALADLRSIARNARDPRQRHYRYAWIPKPRGGHRLVEAPKPRLRGVQRAILDGIVGVITPHDAAYGFRAGRSVADAARQHVGKAVVMRVDLESFFGSVSRARVAGIFRTGGYPEGVAHVLAGLCTHRSATDVLARAPADARDRRDLDRLRTPHLPQGAPTSGALANLAAYRLDVRVAAYAQRLGAAYTRYADDIVLSSDDRALVRAATTVVARLAAIAADEGFALNFRKTRVMTAATRQRVTGIVVNDTLGVPRADVERLRAILHNCCREGPATQNRDGHPDFRAYLRGRIAWVASLDAAKGARLARIFDEIRW